MCVGGQGCTCTIFIYSVNQDITCSAVSSLGACARGGTGTSYIPFKKVTKIGRGLGTMASRPGARVHVFMVLGL